MSARYGRKELERNIEGRAIKWARGKGWKVKKMNGLGDRAWPDRLFLLRVDCFAFIEFKRKGEEPTEQQWDNINDLRRRGFNAEYFDDSDAAIAYLRALDTGRVPKARGKVRGQ